MCWTILLLLSFGRPHSYFIADASWNFFQLFYHHWAQLFVVTFVDERKPSYQHHCETLYYIKNKFNKSKDGEQVIRVIRVRFDLKKQLNNLEYLE